MLKSTDAVSVARTWIGTPYIHQCSNRGAGTDCLGLIRGIWRELYGNEPEEAPCYTADWGECGSRELLLEGALRHLVPLAVDRPVTTGEVLLFRMREGAIAKHLGIVSDAQQYPKFIHAYDRHGVVECPLSVPWQQRIAARFRFP